MPTAAPVDQVSGQANSPGLSTPPPVGQPSQMQAQQPVNAVEVPKEEVQAVEQAAGAGATTPEIPESVRTAIDQISNQMSAMQEKFKQ